MTTCSVCRTELQAGMHFCPSCGAGVNRADRQQDFELGKLAAVTQVQDELLCRLRKYAFYIGLPFLLLSWVGVDIYLKRTAEEVIKEEIGVDMKELKKESERAIKRLDLITVDSVGASVQYRSAFAETQRILQESLITFDDARKRFDKLKSEWESAESELEFPIYDPNRTKSDSDSILSIRLATIDLISVYNDILVAVLAGHGDEQVSVSISSFRRKVQDLDGVYSGAPVGQSFETVLEKLSEELPTDKVFEKYVSSLEAGGPLVRSLINLLRKDTENYYNVRVGLTHLTQDSLLDRVADLVFAVDRDIKSYRSSSSDDIKSAKSFEARLNEMLPKEEFPDYKLELGESSDLPTMTPALKSRMNLYFTLMEDYLERVQMRRALVNDYSSLLYAYVKFLDEVNRTLHTLSTKILEQSRPTDSSEKSASPNYSMEMWRWSQVLLTANSNMRRAYLEYRMSSQSF